MSCVYTYFQLIESSFETCLPVTQEELLRGHAQTSHQQRIRYRPVAWFRHHILRLRINGFDGLAPLWMIHLGLCGLQDSVNGSERQEFEQLTFPIGCRSWTSVSAKALFRRNPCAFENDFDNVSMNSAASSNASGGQTYGKGWVGCKTFASHND